MGTFREPVHQHVTGPALPESPAGGFRSLMHPFGAVRRPRAKVTSLATPMIGHQGTDEKLNSYDAAFGKETAAGGVVADGEEPRQRQQPRSALSVQGETAFATAPATTHIHVINRKDGTVVRRIELSRIRNDATGGSVPKPAVGNDRGRKQKQRAGFLPKRNPARCDDRPFRPPLRCA
ncbi:hypothetical protein E9229_001912 [Paeniglutamicibacter cryotolerans]|uniref:Uncharacterized protein n=1 Tax=Paeniglutamicibacter cryotolerans TaxID=670079 RepID=A0A839QUN4_9MICC|nr:hypothetical protein [Paeniglutamicibacter cryotolerans]